MIDFTVHDELTRMGNTLPPTASLLNLDRDPSRTSEKYKTTDDIAVVKQLNSLGWFIQSYKQVKAHDINKAPYKGYVATYHNPSFPKFGTEGNLTLLQRNSKDGLKRFSFSIGFYRFVCENGLIVGTDLFEPIGIKHVGDLPSQVESVVMRAATSLPDIYDRMSAMQTTILTNDEIMEFAKRSLTLRFKEGERAVEVQDIIKPRRTDDNHSDLWHVFNRVQENLINTDKSFKSTSSEGKQRAVRSVRNIDLSFKVNTGLWSLAETFIR